MTNTPRPDSGHDAALAIAKEIDRLFMPANVRGQHVNGMKLCVEVYLHPVIAQRDAALAALREVVEAADKVSDRGGQDPILSEILGVDPSEWRAASDALSDAIDRHRPLLTGQGDLEGEAKPLTKRTER